MPFTYSLENWCLWPSWRLKNFHIKSFFFLQFYHRAYGLFSCGEFQLKMTTVIVLKLMAVTKKIQWQIVCRNITAPPYYTLLMVFPKMYCKPVELLLIISCCSNLNHWDMTKVQNLQRSRFLGFENFCTLKA